MTTEKINLYLTVGRLFLLPICIWILKLVGKSLIREFHDTIDVRAAKIFEQRISLVKDSVESVVREIRYHAASDDKMFQQIGERLDVLIHRSSPIKEI